MIADSQKLPSLPDSESEGNGSMMISYDDFKPMTSSTQQVGNVIFVNEIAMYINKNDCLRIYELIK